MSRRLASHEAVYETRYKARVGNGHGAGAVHVAMADETERSAAAFFLHMQPHFSLTYRYAKM